MVIIMLLDCYTGLIVRLLSKKLRQASSLILHRQLTHPESAFVLMSDSTSPGTDRWLSGDFRRSSLWLDQRTIDVIDEIASRV